MLRITFFDIRKAAALLRRGHTYGSAQHLGLLLAICLFLEIPAGWAQTPETLGNVTITKGSAITPSAADTYFGSATLHTNDLGLPRAPEIKAAARALGHDPDRIYEFIRNKIEITPLFGLQKGALGALVERRGTAFDQVEDANHDCCPVIVQTVQKSPDCETTCVRSLKRG